MRCHEKKRRYSINGGNFCLACYRLRSAAPRIAASRTARSATGLSNKFKLF